MWQPVRHNDYSMIQKSSASATWKRLWDDAVEQNCKITVLEDKFNPLKQDAYFTTSVASPIQNIQTMQIMQIQRQEIIVYFNFPYEKPGIWPSDSKQG